MDTDKQSTIAVIIRKFLLILPPISSLPLPPALDWRSGWVRHACFFCRVMPNATSGDSAESIAVYFYCRGEVTLDK